MSTLRVNRIQAIDESVLNFDTGDINSSGIVTATEFSGSGSSLTNLPAGNLTGALPAIDGSALTGIVSIPTGVIVMWSGSIASIPSGWALCDGTSGTPDLRDRFVVGAGNGYAVAGAGGTANAVVVSHSHDITDTGHNHNLLASSATDGGAGSGWRWESNSSTRNSTVNGTNITSQTTGISINSQGVSGTNANLPPYYALAFIMKT